MVLDGIGDLLIASGDSQRVHDYLYAFTQHLARHRVSSILTFETRMGLREQGDRLTDALRFSGLTDSIVLFDIEPDSLRRTACVLKARNSAHELAIREMGITAGGIRIG
jgi:KaiC/GvpD/RAD55 family RecA-like ATPase